MAGLVPAISIRRGAAPQSIGIIGTGPVMTGEEASALRKRASQDGTEAIVAG
jgi:hypothetical protein